MRIWILCVSMVMVGLSGCQKSETTHPQPTEFAHSEQDREARRIYKQHRREWMEQMHRTAPDVDWRQVDEVSRMSKVVERLNARKRLKVNGLLVENSPITEAIGATALQGRWIERGSNNLAGRMVVSEVDIGRRLIYAGSAGGNVWRGNLDGTGWRSLNDYMKITGIETVRLIPTTQGLRLIASQNSPTTIYYTDDEGLTWDSATGLENAVKWGSLKRTVVTSGDQPVIYVLLEEWDYGSQWRAQIAVYKSTDRGTSFRRIRTFPNTQKKVCDLWAPRYGAGLPFLIVGNAIHQFDAQDNLNPISTIGVDFAIGDGSHSNTNLSGLVSGSATTLYACFVVSNQCRIYRSTNAGLTWQYRGTADTGLFFETNSFISSSRNPDRLYAGGVECFRSYDGGLSWAKLNGWGEYYGDPTNKLHADIPGINVFRDIDDLEFVLISTDGGTYISRDGLRSVKNLSLKDLRISQYYTTFTHRTQPEYVYAGSQDQGFQRTLPSQATPAGLLDFKQTISGDYGHIVSGDGGDSLWTVYPGFAMYYPNVKTSDSNLTWGFNELKGQLWMPPLMADPDNPSHVYLAGGSSNGSAAHLYHLEVSGSSIIATEQPYDFSEGISDRKISAMAYSPINSNHRYVLTSNGEFFHSGDGGTTWTKSPAFNGPDSHYFYGSEIIPSPISEGEVFIAGSGYSNPPVYRSADYGQHFAAFNEGIPNTLVFDMAITPDGSTLFAATEVGPYIRQVDQTDWIDLAGNSGPDQTFWSVDYIHSLKSARFGTYGRGIWDFQMVEPQAGDFEPNGTVNLSDFAQLAQAWQSQVTQENWNPVCDISGPADNIIDLFDLASFTESWLEDLSLLGRWSMDQTGGGIAVDSAFSPHDGTLKNMAETAWVPGRTGNALQFDGVDDYVEISGFKGISGARPRTILAWIKTTGIVEGIVYWGKKDAAGGMWDMRVNTQGQLRLQLFGGAGINGVTKVNTGEWTYVGIVLPETADNVEDAILYVNGVREAKGALVAGSINTVTQSPVRIGTDESGKYFAGLIDDVQIFNRALSPEELRIAAGLLVVDAGTDREVPFGIGGTAIPAALAGTVVSGTVASARWTGVSGPGEPVFADATALNTQVVFPAEGQYTLRLTAVNGTDTWQSDVVLMANRAEAAHWRLNAGFLDHAGGHTGTAHGDPVFVDSSQARIGIGAVDLDGNDWIQAEGYTGIAGAAPRTCMVWIRTVGAIEPILYWGKNTIGGMWDMRINKQGQLRLQVFGGAGINSVTQVNTGEWMHVAIVLPPGSDNVDDAILYVNGVREIGGAKVSGAVNTVAQAEVRIGADETGLFFTGLLDDVRIFSRALSAEEIVKAMEGAE